MRATLSEPLEEGDAHPTWRDAPLTVALLVVCSAVFVASWGHCLSNGGEWSETVLGMSGCDGSLEMVGGLRLGRLWENGEWWRVGSAGLAHGSWLHLTLNMWSLWVVGPWAERAWGPWRAGLIFALSSVGGCLASAAWVEAPLVVGASAGILGLAGAVWLGRLWGSDGVRRKLEPVSARGLGIMLAILVGLGFAVPMVAQAGHIGGLVVGLGIGAALSCAGQRRWVGVAGTLVWLGAAGWGAGHSEGRPRHPEFRGFFLLAAGEPGAAAPWFDQALLARPDDAELQNAVAYALAEAGEDLARAEGLVRSALETEPENPDYLDTLGWTLCQAGRVEEGSEWLRRAVEAEQEADPVVAEHLRTCAAAHE